MTLFTIHSQRDANHIYKFIQAKMKSTTQLKQTSIKPLTCLNDLPSSFLSSRQNKMAIPAVSCLLFGSHFASVKPCGYWRPKVSNVFYKRSRPGPTWKRKHYFIRLSGLTIYLTGNGRAERTCASTRKSSNAVFLREVLKLAAILTSIWHTTNFGASCFYLYYSREQKEKNTKR